MLESVDAIAQQAGSAILEVYGRDFAVVEKADSSPLTEADERAHRLIASHLHSLTPKLPLLSEEDAAGFTGPDVEGRYWLVDPLDGTKEFIRRNGEFTVNIALVERGQLKLGVVHAPVLGLTYLAAEGRGAFKHCDAGPWETIRVAEHGESDPWRIVGSRSHAGDSLTNFIARLTPHELVSMGSSLKLCLVAEGKADLYPRLGPTSLWDTAAAQCVVEQAGGSVVAMDGKRLSYGDPTNLLNPHFLAHGLSATNWAEWLRSSD